MRQIASLWMVMTLLFAESASAQTAAHWRFDGAGKPGDSLSPDVAIVDLSGNGNDLQTFSTETAPRFATTQPSGCIVLDLVERGGGGRGFGRRAIRDLFVRHRPDAGSEKTSNLNHDELSKWTIEARVLFRESQGWERRFQTFVGRDGYNLPNTGPVEESPLANLGFKKRGDDNRIAIEAWDGGRKYASVRSKEPVKPDVWYDVAAVSDGTKLTLSMKGPGDDGYVEQASAAFGGALLNGGGIWTVGRGFHGNAPGEPFNGYVQEVRISRDALSSEQFLATKLGASIAHQEAGKDLPATRPAVASDDGTNDRAKSFPPAPSHLIGVHDPAMLLDGDTFHVFSTHNGINHWRSKDLIHWKELPPVFPNGTPEWARRDIAERAGMWAPDVLFFNGKFHLYYSSSTFGSQRSAIGMATNVTLNPDDPNYKWEDQGKVIESFRGMPFNAIDAALVLDADGNPWMAYGSWNQGIYLSRLDISTGKVSTNDSKSYPLCARPGRNELEAPGLCYRDGWYYLTVSYDFCCRGANSTYKLVIGRSRQVTGPYVDRDGKPMLEGHASLLLRSHSFSQGPGHSSFVKQGARWWMSHHYYDLRDNGVPRLQVRPVHWDDDGWPLVGEPVAEAPAGRAKTEDVAGNWSLMVDYGRDEREFAFDQSGDVLDATNANKSVGKWSRQGERLEIRWSDAAGPVDRCILSDDGWSCVGRQSDGAIVRAVRAGSNKQ